MVEGFKRLLLLLNIEWLACRKRAPLIVWFLHATVANPIWGSSGMELAGSSSDTRYEPHGGAYVSLHCLGAECYSVIDALLKVVSGSMRERFRRSEMVLAHLDASKFPSSVSKTAQFRRHWSGN